MNTLYRAYITILYGVPTAGILYLTLAPIWR